MFTVPSNQPGRGGQTEWKHRCQRIRYGLLDRRRGLHRPQSGCQTLAVMQIKVVSWKVEQHGLLTKAIVRSPLTGGEKALLKTRGGRTTRRSRSV